MSTALQFDISQIGKPEPQKYVDPKTHSSVSKDEFLQLLVTQLKYQDPLKPMNDKEFIGQMAQFSSLEQMQNLNTTFTSNKAMGLMGKYIEGSIVVDDETREIKGLVESVKVSGSKAYAIVNGQDVSVENISKIKDKSEVSMLDDISKYTGLVNKKVKAMTIANEDGDIYKFEGDVNSIRISSDGPLAVINNINTTIDSLVLPENKKQNITNVKEYLQSNIGEEVTAIIQNSDGIKTQVTGTVKSVVGDDTNPNVVFDRVSTTIDSIYEIY